MREVGPRLTDEPMTSDEIVRALQWLKFKGFQLTGMSRAAGLPAKAFYLAILHGRISERQARICSWFLRALLDGNLIAQSMRGKPGRRGKQHFVLAGTTEANPELRRRVGKCICGRYQECPCGVLKPEPMQAWRCLSSLSGAAMPNVVASLTRTNQSQAALSAGQKRFSGFPSKSPPDQTGRRKPTGI